MAALTPRQVYSIFINYIAIDDPLVSIGFILSDQLGAVSQGSGDRKISAKINFKWDRRPANVVGAAFLLGAKFTSPNFNVYTSVFKIIDCQVRKVTADGCILDVSVNGGTNLAYIRIGYIVGDSKVLFVSD